MRATYVLCSTNILIIEKMPLLYTLFDQNFPLGLTPIEGLALPEHFKGRPPNRVAVVSGSNPDGSQRILYQFGLGREHGLREDRWTVRKQPFGHIITAFCRIEYKQDAEWEFFVSLRRSAASGRKATAAVIVDVAGGFLQERFVLLGRSIDFEEKHVLKDAAIGRGLMHA